MMVICSQCNGKKAAIATESIIDLSGNTETLQPCGTAFPQPIPCTQCNGNGYLTMGG